MRRTTQRDLAVVEEYAHELGAHVYWDVPLINDGGPTGPRANTAMRVIHAIPLSAGTPDQGNASFWSTLHELGHVHHEHRNGGFLVDLFGDPEKPEREAEAWVWAINHAGRPVDRIAKTSMAYSLASYIYSNGTADYSPNLDKVLRLVGPDFDVELAREVYGRADGNDYTAQVARIWFDTWAARVGLKQAA